MSQPAGFAEPIDALLAVATCLGDFTIASNTDPVVELTPTFFVGDEGVGGVLDCCTDGKPILRIESTGENPANGAPLGLAKQGCFELSMGIVVTFLTCFKTISKSGVVITDPAELSYSQVIQAARWRAVNMLRCCRNPKLTYASSSPIPSDGKCSGFQINMQAALSLCEPCLPAS